MQNIILKAAAAALGALWLCGCATETYVDEQVAGVRSEMGADRARLNDHDTRIGRLDSEGRATRARLEEHMRFNEQRLAEETVLFDTGVARLSQQDQSKLNALAQRLKSEDADVFIEIHGYTDSQGDEKFNEGLAFERTSTVHKHLQGQGVPLSRMAEIAHGESSPVADNDTAAGRAQNRRVVVAIVN